MHAVEAGPYETVKGKPIEAGRVLTVCFVIPDLGCGGAQRAMATLCDASVHAGWATTLVTLRGDVPDFFPLEAAVGRRCLSRSKRFSSEWPRLALLRRLRRAIRAADPDVVVSFIGNASMLAVAATRGLGIPVVVSENTELAGRRQSGMKRRIRRWIYRYADLMVVQSHAAAQYASRFLVAPAQMRIIPNGVRAPEEKEARRLPPRSIVTLGRLSPEKGYDLLLEAFGLAARDDPEWRLDLFGDGPCREELVVLARELGIEDRVTFRGAVVGPDEAFAHADLFVLSSRYEGHPLVLLEAMAYGLPVVAFDCPSGPREIIRNGVDGILVPANDTGELARAIVRLMRDDDLRLGLASRARRIAIRNSEGEFVREWTEMLREVTGTTASLSNA